MGKRPRGVALHPGTIRLRPKLGDGTHNHMPLPSRLTVLPHTLPGANRDLIAGNMFHRHRRHHPSILVQDSGVGLVPSLYSLSRS